ncbi:hypothetical protein ACT2FY_32330 [Paraburkholderia fungorum]|uniref:hypothetical protein n=1 Tax=Paraburkholderia fungorum TaxID=134537 RepID=UPI00402BA85A
MNRILAALLSGVGLVCALTVSAATPAGVFPQSLQGTQSNELGAVVLALMPPPGQQRIGWDWQADSPIQWQNGYTQNPGATRSYRNGVLRINVMGNVSTVLRQHTDELGWTVTLYTDAPAKFGPDSIAVQPGLPDGGQCFGTLYGGCTFNPLPSLKQAGITAKPLCAFDWQGRPTKSNGNFTRTYAVSAAGKAPALLQWMESEGSGGASTTLTLLLNSTPAKACAPDAP